MFESEFIEGQTKTVDMKEIEDIVSPRSMEALLQWLWHRRVRFDNRPGDQISAAIELCRLADMCNIKGLGAEMALSIKNVLIANRDADPKMNPKQWINLNTRWITENHINSASFLPRGHAVRRILAAASVEGFIQGPNYKFSNQAREHPTFAADLLEEVRCALTSVSQIQGTPYVKDPITGSHCRFKGTSSR